MNQVGTINSKEYWEKRFDEDWDQKGGPDQSRFFARLTTESFPSWFWDVVRKNHMTVADWGCAEGAGTDWLTSYLALPVVGIDFSSNAIKTAETRYPAVEFRCEDWLDDAQPGSMLDVVISSNTLEHFFDPFTVLRAISGHANKAVALLLPYREVEREDEHFFTFLPENIPVCLDNGFWLCHSRVVDCVGREDSKWSGEQIALLYIDPKFFSGLNLMLKDVELAHEDYRHRLTFLGHREKTLEAAVSTLESQLALQTEQGRQLALEVQERKQEAQEREQEVQEREQEVEMLKAQDNEKTFAIEQLQGRLHELESSTIWRSTRPLRMVGTKVKSMFAGRYNLIKALFWRLPAPLREHLHGARHAFVRWARQGMGVTASHLAVGDNDDMSWSEFNSTVLANRSAYRGVFVQEPTIGWNVPLYQRPQHMATALGRLGYLVIYRTIDVSVDAIDGFREVAKNVWLTNASEIDSLEGVVRSVYSTALFATPDIFEKYQDDLIIYEYIDHIDPQISGDGVNVRKLQRFKVFAFAGGVDLVVASAKTLFDEAVDAVGKDRVALVPNGVDTRHYRNPQHNDYSLPPSLTAWADRFDAVVGYFGALAPWLWYDELKKLISNNRNLGFLFIGPDYYGGVEKLPSTENVSYLGAIDYQILPSYARLFDVCLIPFAPGEIAKTTSPLKLFEYFAMEKPVVSTSFMDECVAFPEVFHGDSAESLAEAISAARKAGADPEYRARLRRLADENDWDQRAKAMMDAVEKIRSKAVKNSESGVS